jgi:hypothetical protein
MGNFVNLQDKYLLGIFLHDLLNAKLGKKIQYSI